MCCSRCCVQRYIVPLVCPPCRLLVFHPLPCRFSLIVDRGVGSRPAEALRCSPPPVSPPPHHSLCHFFSYFVSAASCPPCVVLRRAGGATAFVSLCSLPGRGSVGDCHASHVPKGGTYSLQTRPSLVLSTARPSLSCQWPVSARCLRACFAPLCCAFVVFLVGWSARARALSRRLSPVTAVSASTVRSISLLSSCGRMGSRAVRCGAARARAFRRLISLVCPNSPRSVCTFSTAVRFVGRSPYSLAARAVRVLRVADFVLGVVSVLTSGRCPFLPPLSLSLCHLCVACSLFSFRCSLVHAAVSCSFHDCPHPARKLFPRRVLIPPSRRHQFR